MAQQKKKYPSPGDVLWEGGFVDINDVVPVARPNRYLGGQSPYMILVDKATVKDWKESCLKVWQADGSAFFKDFTATDMGEVYVYASQLVKEGKLRAWYPDQAEPDFPYMGVRGEYKGDTIASSGAGQ